MPNPSDKKTISLFWNNPYLREFEAKIISLTDTGIILDKTAFYPTGGGQVSDKGTLLVKASGLALKVILVEKNNHGLVVHKIANKKNLSKLKKNDLLVGKIDWTRRYQLMKGHSSQHLLSAIIQKQTGIKTIKAKITEREVTIYLKNNLTEKELQFAIKEANRLILSNVAVETNIYKQNTIPKSIKENLRGDLESKLESEVRVVSISGTDYSLCGGTHCDSLQEIGILYLINYKKNLLTYYHSQLALDALTKQSIDQISLSQMLAVKPEQLQERVSKLYADYKNSQSTIKSLTKISLESVLSRTKENPIKNGSVSILSADLHFAKRKFVLQELGNLPKNTLGVFLVANDILLVVSSSRRIPANEVIAKFSAETSQKGGGSPTVAQVSSNDPKNDLRLVKEIIASLEKKIEK